MKNVLSMIALLAMPSMAMAHEGHNGVGLFHHMFDILPFVAVVIIAAGAFIWKKNQ
ncbi:hypothetical protein [uncultured Shewanella sp.]|uniref:hypothetical protein n=1 Tax=Shewanella atlantica TaxID=271099 RepID=UPI002626D545|nr:hypothetical protein [uncultured Shewanella sp.]